jgi:hypothetical protein
MSSTSGRWTIAILCGANAFLAGHAPFGRAVFAVISIAVGAAGLVAAALRAKPTPLPAMKGGPLMALQITDTRITSTLPDCDDVAVRGPAGWSVSWLPGRVLDRDQAITAMVLAEVYTLNPPPEHKLWRHVDGWRAELGLPPRPRRSR